MPALSARHFTREANHAPKRIACASAPDPYSIRSSRADPRSGRMAGDWTAAASISRQFPSRVQERSPARVSDRNARSSPSGASMSSYQCRSIKTGSARCVESINTRSATVARGTRSGSRKSSAECHRTIVGTSATRSEETIEKSDSRCSASTTISSEQTCARPGTGIVQRAETVTDTSFEDLPETSSRRSIRAGWASETSPRTSPSSRERSGSSETATKFIEQARVTPGPGSGSSTAASQSAASSRSTWARSTPRGGPMRTDFCTGNPLV